MNRADFQQLADVRIAEAAALLRRRPPMPDGAYYLAGYAVECALKACIAKLIREHDFPDEKLTQECHTHNLVALLRVAELQRAFDAEIQMNPTLLDNWKLVIAWSEQARYGRHTVEKAKELIAAITDTTNGVLPWIKANW